MTDPTVLLSNDRTVPSQVPKIVAAEARSRPCACRHQELGGEASEALSENTAGMRGVAAGVAAGGWCACCARR
jgi:hypothetical protein